MAKKLKQYNVGLSDEMIAKLQKSGKIAHIGLAGYVRTLIDSDLKEGRGG